MKVCGVRYSTNNRYDNNCILIFCTLLGYVDMFTTDHKISIVYTILLLAFWLINLFEFLLLIVGGICT